MNEHTSTIWQLPAETPADGSAGRDAGTIKEWRDLVGRVAGLGLANNWSKAEVARRIGMPDGTFSGWYSGRYTGRLDTTNAKVSQWVAAVEEMETMAAGIPEAPSYYETRTSREITEALLYAQTMPAISVVTVGAGMGKTTTLRHYRDTRPHAHLVTMSPNTRTVFGMLTEIAQQLGVSQQNASRLHRAIGDRVQRNGRKTLLMIDEAQNLCDQAVDQLRAFLDVNSCGIALVGNEEVYDRFARKDGPSYAQIKRRFGKRVTRRHPYPEDVHAALNAWKVSDEDARRVLTGIGNKPGALGQITETMMLAGMVATGKGEAIGARHIKAAWSNRGVEE